jgi:hypothetical protein
MVGATRCLPRLGAETAVIAWVSQARFPAGHQAAGLQVIRQELLPAFRRAAGYRGCVLLVSGRPGSGLAVVLWETEDAADAAAADPTVVAAHVQLADLGLVFESRQVYAVVVHDRVVTRG